MTLSGDGPPPPNDPPPAPPPAPLQEGDPWADPARVEAYAGRFAAGTAQAIPSALAAARPAFFDAAHAEGPRLLDLACGPGRLAAAAAAEDWRVDAADSSPAMVSLASATAREAAVIQSDAAALPYETARFDAVVLAFALPQLRDPAACLREIGRVLRPGGRFVMVNWEPAPRNDCLRIMEAAFARYGDASEGAQKTAKNVSTRNASDPAAYLAIDSAEEMFRPFWLGDVLHQTTPVHWELTAPEELMALYAATTKRVAGRLARQSAEAQDRICKDVARAVTRICAEPGGASGAPARWRVPCPARITSARRQPHSLRGV